MVEAQKRLIDHLGITRLYSIAGGSMGGFQVLEWALRYPELVRSAICIASAARLSAQAIAFNSVGRSAITRDPEWKEGGYDGKGPEHGLATARMVGHITYLSEMLLDTKFGRRLQSANRLSYNFTTEFAIEELLEPQGQRLYPALRRQQLPVHHQGHGLLRHQPFLRPAQRGFCPGDGPLPVCLLQQRLALSHQPDQGDGARPAQQRQAGVVHRDRFAVRPRRLSGGSRKTDPHRCPDFSPACARRWPHERRAMWTASAARTAM